MTVILTMFVTELSVVGPSLPERRSANSLAAGGILAGDRLGFCCLAYNLVA
jgi:hypothetical protein